MFPLWGSGYMRNPLCESVTAGPPEARTQKFENFLPNLLVQGTSSPTMFSRLPMMMGRLSAASAPSGIAAIRVRALSGHAARPRQW